MAQTEKKEMPPAVRDALTALEILRGENTALAEAVQKILPGYAKLMAGRGEEVTVESLLAAARQGTAFLKDATQPTTAPLDFLTQYKNIRGGAKNPQDVPVHSVDYTVDSNDQTALNAKLRLACKNGHTDMVRELIRLGATNAASEGVIDAVCYGRTETLVMLFEDSANIPVFDDHGHKLFKLAAYYDHPETFALLLKYCHVPPSYLGAFFAYTIQEKTDAVFDLLISQGAHTHEPIDNTLFSAFNHKNLRAAQILLDLGLRPSAQSFAHICHATFCQGQSELIDLLAKYYKSEDIINAAWRYASKSIPRTSDPSPDTHFLSLMIKRANIEGVAALIKIGLDARKIDGRHLNVNEREKLEVVDFLVNRGLKLKKFAPFFHLRLSQVSRDVARWKVKVRCHPPNGLSDKDPSLFKPALFENVLKILGEEGYVGLTQRRYAYNIMALFQSEERILQYLEKWGRGKESPLQETCYAIQLPTDTRRLHLADWGDAILKHGPQMAKLIKFCDKLPSPLKSDDGKTWSYSKTRSEVAQYAYTHAAEHPELAALCFEQAIDEASFDAALQLTRHPIKIKNMPEITLHGERFDMAGATFKKLANDDVRGLFLGELTDCCQSIGGAGENCATHGFISANGGFYVLETAKGEIIGQSWAWRGDQGELCFDSLEALGSRVSDDQWLKLVQAVAQELTVRSDHNVTALHVGLGGKTPLRLRDAFKNVTARPVDYSGYRDSKKQVRVWQR